ncbi:MAG: hypothetical protein ABSG43_00430 [Solirubrobacteraceae bacterium]|jgi:hypothetical protein
MRRLALILAALVVLAAPGAAAAAGTDYWLVGGGKDAARSDVVTNAGAPSGYSFTSDLGPVGETRRQFASALAQALLNLPSGVAVEPSYTVPRFGTVTTSGPGGVVGGLDKGAKAVGDAVSCVAGSLDCVTNWVVGGAQQLDKDVMSVASGSGSAPQLGSGWFAGVYQYVWIIGAALGGVFTMVGLAGATLKRSGRAFGELLYGVFRAGVGSAVAVAVVILALGVCDQLASDIAGNVPTAFFDAISTGWGQSGFGGFGSSFLALIVALVMVIVEALLWFELLIRGALLYVAVALLPLVFAASIWPALNRMLHRVVFLVGVLLVLPVVAMLVLLVGAAIVGGGLSGTGGVVSSATTILEGLAVFATAALAPWALLTFVGMEAGVMGKDRAGGPLPGAKVGGDLMRGPVDAAAGGAGVGTGGGDAAAGSAAAGGAAAGGASDGANPAGGGNPTRGSAASSGARAPRPITGAVAAAAGWLSAAGDVGANVAAHVGARAAAASGRYGSQPADTPWNALGPPRPSRGGSGTSTSAEPSTSGRLDRLHDLRDAAASADAEGPSVEGLPPRDTPADPFGADVFDANSNPFGDTRSHNGHPPSDSPPPGH